MNELNITLDYTNACRTNTSTAIRRFADGKPFGIMEE